ncbi:MAG: hypothetical protein VR67_17530 [Peptococcaceae bacterium BRH_c8a]|nr:MAG: hypothetical protein VR67_17530 [Peptococcaceae bacterium BRH_c8a]
MIQEILGDRESFDPEEIKMRDEVMDSAMAGAPGANTMAVKYIQSVMERYSISVTGMNMVDAAYEIYKYVWGLDVLEELYNNPNVDEIRVNGTIVTIQYRAKNMETEVRLKDAYHVMKIILRLIRHDRGVALTDSTPRVESMRRDGTRITATCPPFSRKPTLVLRKPTFKMTLDNLTRAGTLNDSIYNYIKLLVQGRANILISGGCGSGKTSLLRHLVSFMHPRLRIVVLENDMELNLGDHYPDREDIVEFEEHPELGLTLKEAFRTVLRYSPDVIIVGEMRGVGEADEAIKACTRGHDGSLATGHFTSVEESIEGTALMLIEEGKNLPLSLAKLQVARAFNIVIQLYTSPVYGVKKITRIAEIWPEGDKVVIRDLVVWQSQPDDFLSGEWRIMNPPSERLTQKMHQYGITSVDFREAGVFV